jgi:hypothetical protein
VRAGVLVGLILLSSLFAGVLFMLQPASWVPLASLIPLVIVRFWLPSVLTGLIGYPGLQPVQVHLTHANCASTGWFASTQDGPRPRFWFSRGEKDRIRIFNRPGYDPQTGVRLAPIDVETSRAYCAQVDDDHKAALAILPSTAGQPPAPEPPRECDLTPSPVGRQPVRTAQPATAAYVPSGPVAPRRRPAWMNRHPVDTDSQPYTLAPVVPAAEADVASSWDDEGWETVRPTYPRMLPPSPPVVYVAAPRPTVGYWPRSVGSTRRMHLAGGLLLDVQVDANGGVVDVRVR